MTCIHGKNNCSICYTAGYLATPDVIVEQPSLPPLPLTVEQIEAFYDRLAHSADKQFRTYGKDICDQALAALSLQSECEALRRALNQASFCLRELLPNDADAKMTVGIIDAALASGAER